jgi:hypothetical protein
MRYASCVSGLSATVCAMVALASYVAACSGGSANGGTPEAGTDGGGSPDAPTEGGSGDIPCADGTMNPSEAILVRYQYQYPGAPMHTVCAPLLYLRDRYARPVDGGACMLKDTEAYAFISSLQSPQTFGFAVLQPGVELFAHTGTIEAGVQITDDVLCPPDAGPCSFYNLSCQLQIVTAGGVGATVEATLAAPCDLPSGVPDAALQGANILSLDLKGTISPWTDVAGDAGPDAAVAPCP